MEHASPKELVLFSPLTLFKVKTVLVDSYLIPSTASPIVTLTPL